VKGVWNCFGGGGSYSGYGKIGWVLSQTGTELSIVRVTDDMCRFDRRFRVYEISEYGETIRTWKRTESDEIIDEMVLVGKGAAPPYRGPR
jgi:hypothetical protein